MTETRVEDQPEVQVEVVQQPASKGELVPAERDQRLQSMKSGIGGIAFESMLQVMEFAKLMAKAGTALPPHLRDNPGGCLAATIKALEWGFSPFTVANWQYEVNNRGVVRVAYESQAYHAVIEARAPIKERLRFEYIGEGDAMFCRITFTIKGEEKPRVFDTEPLGKLRPPRGEGGAVKGSPLYDKKPKQQLAYNGTRDVARLYFPDIFGGVYTKEEIEEAAAERARDVTPGNGNGAALHERLKQAVENGDGESGEGFSQEAATELGEQPAAKPEKPAKRGGKKGATQEPSAETRTSEPSKPAAEPSTEAKAAPFPVDVPKSPKTLKQYREWVSYWLKTHEDVDEIETRWAGAVERKLRNACNMTSEDKAEVRKLVDARIEELEGGQ